MTDVGVLCLCIVAVILIIVAAGRIEDLQLQGKTRKANILASILVPSTMIGAILFMVFFVVPKIHS